MEMVDMQTLHKHHQYHHRWQLTHQTVAELHDCTSLCIEHFNLLLHSNDA